MDYCYLMWITANFCTEKESLMDLLPNSGMTTSCLGHLENFIQESVWKVFVRTVILLLLTTLVKYISGSSNLPCLKYLKGLLTGD